MDASDLLQFFSSREKLNKEQVTDSHEPEYIGKAVEVLIDSQRKEIDKQCEEIENLKQDREQRKKFSSHIFIFMCAYMAVSLAIVFLCGLGVMTLDVSVLITLLTTTLANVIGVFTFVAKYLFHNK